uniref:uncharacterized protein LOC120961128 n=1 Tax=Anopheles coluzzii TaxID=1518534 RepID=UPI0020FF94F1|nr:uncharacterized protein LOC120961128 [Anopheles coluzzii]
MSKGWAVSDISQSDEQPDAKEQDDMHFAARKTTNEWLSGSWPLRHFDETVPTNKRKAEWIRFRDQFKRIVACKAPVDSKTRVTGLKIFAGSYLLSIIEMQQRNLPSKSEDIYNETIRALDDYFSDLCDASKERMKFREMKMKVHEPFADWVLRLEKQAVLCEFVGAQREEEIMQAVVRRSVPEISAKLYEMANFFGNNLERVISHGKHLDFIRTEEAERKPEGEEGNSAQSQDDRRALIRPVNAILSAKVPANRYKPYETKWSKMRDTGSRVQKNEERREGMRLCTKCGRTHGWGQCKAFRAKCFSCGRTGHFAEFCFAAKRNHNTMGMKQEAERVNQLITGKATSSGVISDPRIVNCVIGSVEFKFLVDSGATVNTVTKKGWERIKEECSTVIQDITLHPEEILKGYATHRPLEVICSFRAYVGVKDAGQDRQLASFL